ncbi:hypothetical protein RYX36_021766 [Vicia faba]
MTEMLEFWRSLLRKSNPSTLNAAHLSPKLTLAHPPLRDVEVGDGKPDGDGDMISSPKQVSWTKRFAAWTGGDTQKYGGDEAS